MTLGIAEDIRDYLVSLSITGVDAAHAFVGLLPESPDAILGVLPSGGLRPEVNMGSSSSARVTARRASLAIQIRAARDGRAAAMTMGEAVYAALALAADFTVNSHRYLKVEAQGDLFVIVPDGNERPLIGFNVEAWKAGA